MRKNEILKGLDKWKPLPELPNSNKVIRHAYEEVVSACARLHTFATSKRPGKDELGTLSKRQELLAIDDLISFAIHARRLIENAVGKKRFDSLTLRPHVKGAPTTPPRVIRIIDVLIHHTKIEIIRSDWDAQLKAREPEGSKAVIALLAELSFNKNRDIPPVVIVQSDRGEAISFELKNMIETFTEQALLHIVDFSQRNGLYLEQDI